MTISSRVVLLVIWLFSDVSHGFQTAGKAQRRQACFGLSSDPDTSTSDSIVITPSSRVSPLDGVKSSTGHIVQDYEPHDENYGGVSLIAPKQDYLSTNSTTVIQASTELSRRQWLFGAAAVGGLMGTGLMTGNFVPPQNVSSHVRDGVSKARQLIHRQGNSSSTSAAIAKKNKKLQKINIRDVVRESTINLTMECTTTCVSLDQSTFEMKATLKLPSWIPPFLIPPPRTVRKFSNSEILVAAIVAGSTVEMARTTLLYPLLTLENRIQADIKTRMRTRMKRGKIKRLHLKRRVKIIKWNTIRHYREGKLYAGLFPSLLVSVPATGVYYGVRDVSRRALTAVPGMGDITNAVSAAFIADVVSLMIRAPADTLAIRLQVATGQESRVSNETQQEADDAVERKVGNWFVESLERLPALILTDLPYLLSRIALNRWLIHGSIDLGRYELIAISTALVCGVLTTPFDVARTRILVDSDDDPTNGIDGGSGMGLITTMHTIAKEGNGGIANLFAGWLERTINLAIGRAWLEPLQILGYMALRDAILLEWFD